MNRKRADDGNGHQHIHVEREALDRPPRLGYDEPTARDDCDAEGNICHPNWRQFCPLNQQTDTRKDTRDCHGDLPHSLGSLQVHCIVAIACRRHSGRRDGSNHLLRGDALVVEKRNLSADQIHPHLPYALQRTQDLLERLDFICAVHPRNAQGGLPVAAGFGIRREVSWRLVGIVMRSKFAVVMFVWHTV